MFSINKITSTLVVLVLFYNVMNAQGVAPEQGEVIPVASDESDSFFEQSQHITRDFPPAPIEPNTLSRDDRGGATVRAVPLRSAWVLDGILDEVIYQESCLLYTSPSPRDGLLSRMPSSA